MFMQFRNLSYIQFPKHDEERLKLSEITINHIFLFVQKQRDVLFSLQAKQSEPSLLKPHLISSVSFFYNILRQCSIACRDHM